MNASSSMAYSQATSTNSAAVYPHGQHMPSVALLPTPAPSTCSPSVIGSPLLSASDLQSAYDYIPASTTSNHDLGFSRSPSPLSDLEDQSDDLSGMSSLAARICVEFSLT